MELLDEVANAEVSDLFIAEKFMVHFHLKKEADSLDELVPVELEGFGEHACDFLCERIYPVYSKASMKADEDLPNTKDVPKEKRDAAFKTLNEAIITERMRRWASKEPQLSDDSDVAKRQQEHDVPRPMAEKAVKERGRRAMAQMPHSDKVQ